MKLTIEPTDRFETINGQPHRIWEGTNEAGTPVHVYARAVSAQTHDETLLAAFDVELKALPPARRENVSYDLRLFVD